MDLIDIHMQVPRVEYQKLRNRQVGGILWEEVRKRVEAARESLSETLNNRLTPELM